ncbi:hypothetical protein PPL_09027 [Heterostelium album PN500]|uniref:Uncharacterized protein n=1 Tax=Heterostelium pallidum (strain ATCC 26659 / Pp 5 / PN500) TaxID=670386 RepID=D3BKE6_HETP5|nr:hypothetical protein PPL_09027 [Heterostelium album PN500]EFA78376.1 hypothetical protein PPL_09027 [Heterostelium album PN500]|eukprot:XP_020430501.1 hypothetical protein PPL_09027 [Heterostelium album PN500]
MFNIKPTSSSSSFSSSTSSTTSSSNKSNKFVNFKWSPNSGDLLIFESNHYSKKQSKSSSTSKDKDVLKIQKDDILCEIRKVGLLQHN